MSKKHMGSSIDDFLKEEGIFEEAQAQAVKEVVAWQLADAMRTKKISKVRMATLLKTSRTQVDRLLDPKNDPLGFRAGNSGSLCGGPSVRRCPLPHPRVLASRDEIAGHFTGVKRCRARANARPEDRQRLSQNGSEAGHRLARARRRQDAGGRVRVQARSCRAVLRPDTRPCRRRELHLLLGRPRRSRSRIRNRKDQDHES